MREVILTSILYGFDLKNGFLEGWSWFKFNNLGLGLNTNLKFYTSVEKGLKLKVRMFWRLFLRLQKLQRKNWYGVGEPPPIPNMVKLVIGQDHQIGQGYCVSSNESQAPYNHHYLINATLLTLRLK